MRVYIIIPAYNEEKYLSATLDSLINQTVPASNIIIADDNSTDNTATICKSYVEKHPNISYIKTSETGDHLPGSKVINAFYQAYNSIDQEYDIICKFDADLIFPSDYLKTICTAFTEDPAVGMAGGFCYIQKNDTWVLENLTNKDHIRGALKAYRKSCFEAIGGLKTAMGWDTVDELLAQYHQWSIKTIETLHVKHLKPTGHTYTAKARYKQGEAFYKMRYGFIITVIASIKLALLKKKPLLFFDYIIGFFKAKQHKCSYLVSKKEGAYIRSLRWKKIKEKILR